jgi:cytidylate kinase
MNNPIIAIDGHSSCGKSTLAKDVAAKLNYKYIDTGAMYRAVTLYALEQNLISEEKTEADKLLKHFEQGKINIVFRPDEKAGKSLCFLNGKNVDEAIRKPNVNNFVSPIAALPFVRAEMLKQQRAMGKFGGVVMEGRDIGTAVFPNADLKIFLTADIETRAERRYKELMAKGIEISMEEVKKNLAERDHIDSTRQTAPLKKASDAKIIDNSNLDRTEQTQLVLSLLNEK